MPSTTGSNQNQDQRPTFAFEHVAAKLEPFDLLSLGISPGGNSNQNFARTQLQAARVGTTSDPTTQSAAVTDDGGRSNRSTHALFPIFQTQGLVFPYNPIISENTSIKYDAIELTHTNESFHAYRGTDNVRINISNAMWTCDTFENAIYALAVLHFFRTYSMMDFGRGRSGRPPSPMWFSAYGNYAFHRVPVLMEKADWSFPNDIDYVGIPESGSPEYINRQIVFERKPGSSNAYTWLPMKFEVSGISLIVQHSPRFWTNWNLDDFRSGNMVRVGRKSFHNLPGADPRKPTRQGGSNLDEPEL